MVERQAASQSPSHLDSYILSKNLRDLLWTLEAGNDKFGLLSRLHLTPTWELPLSSVIRRA